MGHFVILDGAEVGSTGFGILLCLPRPCTAIGLFYQMLMQHHYLLRAEDLRFASSS